MTAFIGAVQSELLAASPHLPAHKRCIMTAFIGAM